MIRRIAPALAVIGLVLVGIQLVPYRVHNPPVTQQPEWDSPQTADLARRACLDCHSNETVVPWYGHIAPFSWLVASHVDEARHELNLSEMDREQEEADEAAEVVREGEMPPLYYTMLHSEARLSDVERRQLAAGLSATLGGEDDEHEDEDDDDDSEDDDEESED